uniref:F-actin monooxygenase n=1 Tax=Pavo cristatus TaxID=9049 RepID=A0A8C9FXD0_PAVCR
MNQTAGLTSSSSKCCLIIGGGPCGLRTAIELAFLGAKVVVVEKRDTFSRNNVLHLWPFTIHDLRGLGAKKFYGKFCAGSIDHISKYLRIWTVECPLAHWLEKQTDKKYIYIHTKQKNFCGPSLNDYIDTELLLSGENVNQSNLLSYAREAADFATNYQLPSLDFAINHYGQPDVAMFDFTSMYASENAALVRERHRHQLLVALVGDSLLEVVWVQGVRLFFHTCIFFFFVRESIYRLLPQTTPENINKNFDQYTIDPGTRYPNLNSSCVRPHQVRQLYVTNELQQCSLERASSIRRSVNLSRRESDIRPNKLLTWCQKQTEGYRNVNVTDLTTSWKSGLALCAIIHRFRPDLIDFDALNEEDIVKNNQLAFDVAEREFGIPPLTTGKEVGSAEEPDKLSMVMYLSKFYELFRGTPLRTVDAGDKQNGESNELCSAKSSNFIFNNYINLTLPRKRVPKVNCEGWFASGFSSQGTSVGKEQNDGREGINQNKVKSMATQLLAKFEENAPNTIFRRQVVLERLQHLDEKMKQKRAQTIANREFHKKNIKEKAAHLASLFGYMEFPKNKLPTKGLSHSQPPTPSCPPPHDSAAASSPSSVGSASPVLPSRQMTVGKVSCAIGAMAEVLVNLYVNDHRPKPQIPPLELGSLRKEFPQSIGGSDICYFCKKRVYVMERLSAEGHFFHRECFKCEICSTTLRLGIYAFDVEEGKFYCKPHFTHCKLSNKHRKRRATLQVQSEAWKKEELRPTETTTDSTLTTPMADEPTSPKKAKSILEHLNVESWFSSPDPEWATVRVIPEEEMTEHNLLAVRVMVTSDASRPCFEGRGPWPRAPRPFPAPQCPLPAGHCWGELMSLFCFYLALQRANSFHSTALNKYQSWRRKIQTSKYSLRSNCFLLALHPVSLLINVCFSISFPLKIVYWSCKLASYKKPPEVTRGHVKPYSPEFQRKASERPRDVHPHVPHCPFQSKVKGSPQIPPGNGAWAADFSEVIDGETGTYAGQEKDERNTRHPEEKLEQELKEAKKRLVLRTEQRPTYDSNGLYLGGTTLKCQNKKVLGISNEKDPEWRRGVFKPSGYPMPLLFVDDVPPALPVDMKDVLRSPDKTAKEHSAGRPKSPLRLIANAIRRSILEPLTSSPEGLKQDSDSKTEASSEQAFFSFPSFLGHRNTNNNRASNSQPQDPHSRPSKTPSIPQKPTCTRMEDVPGLLEKFTFNETPSVAPRDGVFICNEKYPLASSREPRNTPKDSLHDSAQKGSLSLFERLRGKWLPLYCWKSLRRRRKLEKETKQLIKQEELKRLHKAQAIQRQLEEVEERQRALEVFGVQLERELRGESISGTQDETQMLHEWFELVLEKNKLMRYESELLIVAQELELEDHQSRLEQKLREKMAIDDSLKNEMDLNEEDEIFIEMMKVVEERDKLVSALEEQRVKEQAEGQHFESILLSRGCQLSGI